jgi:choline dehydrogenase-like flavoprotein
MKKVVVVGSGASGVHFALTVLRKGYEVLLLDVGRRAPEPVNPSDSFSRLKETLPDPADYFLGRNYESVLFPRDEKEYYGFPPGKQYIFDQPAQFRHRGVGFAPLFSFARGGLAETWTGGSYPLNDGELSDFPFSYEAIRPHYDEVARRIGINGAADDLARDFPVHEHLQEPLRLDEHGERLLAGYSRKKRYLNESLGCYVGRSRVATLSRDQGGRKACSYLGRCLWGCPNRSLYTPSLTLAECHQYPNFRYQPNSYVRHFEFDESRRVTALVCEEADTRARFRVPVDALVLAAGTMMSSKIFLESIRQATGQVARLTGLMDNRQVMMPYVNLRMIGRPFNADSYQYHQVAMGFEASDPRHFVHCQVTTLKTALVHPIVQSAPFNMRTALYLFRHIHAALGLVNVNLHDTRRPGNYVTLDADAADEEPRLAIHYAPADDEPSYLKQVLARVKKALWALGCVVPPGMTRVRPMGASVHYAGTIPMTTRPEQFTATPDCRSNDFDNLYFVDGTTFPFLPAKNLTFTLMANAVRVAEAAF